MGRQSKLKLYTLNINFTLLWVITEKIRTTWCGAGLFGNTSHDGVGPPGLCTRPSEPERAGWGSLQPQCAQPLKCAPSLSSFSTLLRSFWFINSLLSCHPERWWWLPWESSGAYKVKEKHGVLPSQGECEKALHKHVFFSSWKCSNNFANSSIICVLAFCCIWLPGRFQVSKFSHNKVSWFYLLKCIENYILSFLPLLFPSLHLFPPNFKFSKTPPLSHSHN